MLSTSQDIICDVLPEHAFDQNRLFQYLKENLEGIGSDLHIKQFQGGQSNPTFLLTTGENRYVLRKKPPGKLLPKAHMIEREYQILRALRSTPVPVPEAVLWCDDDSIVGTPFYLMRFVDGKLFEHPMVVDETLENRKSIYLAMSQTLADLHNADWQMPELQGFGKPDDFYARQISRWTKQYLATCEHPAGGQAGADAMAFLIDWLPNNIPNDDSVSIVHGDYRIGNMLFDHQCDKVAALLDWELATIGHPLADLAYCCIPYRLPSGMEGVKGLAGLDLAELGIPTEQEFVQRYCQAVNRDSIDNWPFYLAFSMFRLAAILQGVYSRALQGNASSSNALKVGERCALLATTACEVLNK